MKTLTRLLTVAALASLFALPSFAQDAAAAANPCESAERTDLYTKYFNEKKAQDQAPAFETAKQYLAKYETACPDQYTKAVRKFHDAYAAASGKANLQKAFYEAVNAKDARRTIEAARALAAAEPDNAGIYLLTGYTGYTGVVTKGSPVFQDPAVTSETLAAVNRAIEMIQAGKEPKDISGKTSWAPFKGRDDALNYALLWAATLQYKNNPEAAIKQLVTVAQSNTEVKEQPGLYTVLVDALETERAALAQKYTATCKELTPECEVMLANINQNVDRQIDGLARAVAYEKDATRKAALLTTLKGLYKDRHKVEEGLDAKVDALVASARTTPLLVTTPVTTPPPPAPTPTPTPGNGQPAAERKP